MSISIDKGNPFDNSPATIEKRHNLSRQKKPSGVGDGKWEDTNALNKFRKSRDKKRKAAKAARKRNKR